MLRPPSMLLLVVITVIGAVAAQDCHTWNDCIDCSSDPSSACSWCSSGPNSGFCTLETNSAECVLPNTWYDIGCPNTYVCNTTFTCGNCINSAACGWCVHGDNGYCVDERQQKQCINTVGNTWWTNSCPVPGPPGGAGLNNDQTFNSIDIFACVVCGLTAFTVLGGMILLCTYTPHTSSHLSTQRETAETVYSMARNRYLAALVSLITFGLLIPAIAINTWSINTYTNGYTHYGVFGYYSEYQGVVDASSYDCSSAVGGEYKRCLLSRIAAALTFTYTVSATCCALLTSAISFRVTSQHLALPAMTTVFAGLMTLCSMAAVITWSICFHEANASASLDEEHYSLTWSWGFALAACIFSIWPAFFTRLSIQYYVPIDSQGLLAHDYEHEPQAPLSNPDRYQRKHSGSFSKTDSFANPTLGPRLVR